MRLGDRDGRADVVARPPARRRRPRPPRRPTGRGRRSCRDRSTAGTGRCVSVGAVLVRSAWCSRDRARRPRPPARGRRVRAAVRADHVAVARAWWWCRPPGRARPPSARPSGSAERRAPPLCEVSRMWPVAPLGVPGDAAAAPASADMVVPRVKKARRHGMAAGACLPRRTLPAAGIRKHNESAGPMSLVADAGPASSRTRSMSPSPNALGEMHATRRAVSARGVAHEVADDRSGPIIAP